MSYYVYTEGMVAMSDWLSLMSTTVGFKVYKRLRALESLSCLVAVRESFLSIVCDPSKLLSLSSESRADFCCFRGLGLLFILTVSRNSSLLASLSSSESVELSNGVGSSLQFHLYVFQLVLTKPRACSKLVASLRCSFRR